jgi:hypothetical protein
VIALFSEKMMGAAERELVYCADLISSADQRQASKIY